MPIILVPYAIPSHFDSSWFLQRDTSPSCRWDQLRFPTAAGSRPGACKLARQDDGICLRTNEILNAYYTHTCEYQSTDFLVFIYKLYILYIYIHVLYNINGFVSWQCVCVCVQVMNELPSLVLQKESVLPPSGWISSQCCVT